MTTELSHVLLQVAGL